MSEEYPNAAGPQPAQPETNGQVPFDQQSQPAPQQWQPGPESAPQQQTEPNGAPFAPQGQFPQQQAQPAGGFPQAQPYAPSPAPQFTPAQNVPGTPGAGFAPAQPAGAPAGVPVQGAPASPGTPAPVPGAPVPGSPYPPVAGAPAPGMPGAPLGPAATQKKKMPTGAIIGIIAGVIAAVVAIILIVVFVVVQPFSLKSDDYLDGMNKTISMQKQYSDVSQQVTKATSAVYGSSSKFDSNDAAKLKEQLKEFTQENKAFGDLKVASRDDKVKKQYDAYLKKAKQYEDFATKMATVAVPMNEAAVACDDVPTAYYSDADFYSQYDTYVKGCTAALDKVSKTKDVKAVADYATAVKEYITQLGDIMSQMEALGDPSNIQYGTDAYNKFRDLTTKFYDLQYPYDASTDLSDALRKLSDDANPSEALDDLNSVCQDGFNEKL